MKNSKFQSLIKFIKSNEKVLSLIFVLLFSSLILATLIWINYSQDILGRSYRDVYFYLIEALRFSGYSIGGYEYVNYLSPLIPFLTSLLFRVGMVSEISIFIVTGIFYVLGVLGFYSLLKIRFKNILSLLGAIVYAGLSINLLWVANGTIDIPSVSLTILSLYFFILAVENNQKYFYLAFPIAVLGFFAKYTAGLAIPLMILYILSKPNIIYNIKKYIKNGLGGLITGGLTTLPFLANFYINNIPLGFVNQAQEIASKTSSTELSNELFYYLINVSSFIYKTNHIFSYIIIAITIVGLSIGIYKALKLLKNRYDNSKKFNNGKIRIITKNISNNIVYFLLTLNLVVIALSFLTASQISFIYSEIIFFISIVTFSYLINKIINIYSNKMKKFFNFDLFMFSWFLSYLIFFSAHIVKADRYFTTLAPGFVFMVVLAVNFILNSLDSFKSSDSATPLKSSESAKLTSPSKETNKITKKLKTLKIAKVAKILKKPKNIELIKKIIPIAIMVTFILASFGYLSLNKHDSLVSNEKEVVTWLKNHDPNYNTKIIWAERGPIFTWYLQKEVTYVNWQATPEELSSKMIENNVTYFISFNETNSPIHFISIDNGIPCYSPVKIVGNVVVFERN